MYFIAGCVVSSDTVAGAGSAGGTTLPSAKARIIQSVGVHLFVTGARIPPVVENKMER